MSKIFLTGASGYIGGQALYSLVQGHPEYAITALVRKKEDATSIASLYPKVKVLKGDLDDSELVKKAASEASIIINLGSNRHIPSMKAILAGLQSRSTGDPAYWVQVSGGSLLCAPEMADLSFVPGSASSTVYNDWTGIADIVSLTRAYPSRAVDNFVLDVAAQHPAAIKTALLVPGIVFGHGQGPVHQTSVQVPTLARLALERSHAVQVGDGLSRWGHVHVGDLAALVVRLTEAASRQDPRAGLWGPEGIYLTGVGELSFGEIAQGISRAARDQKLIDSAEIEALRGHDADVLGATFYGSNARGEGTRAKELLGWKLSQSLEDEFPRAVAEEQEKRS